VAAQEPPDILDVNIAQRPGPQGPGPACEPVRRLFVQQLQNPLVGGIRIDRLLARPRLVLQPFKALVGIAMPPKADKRGWTPTSLAIERVLRPAAASRTIRARFKSRCNVTGERQHTSSTLRSFLERWTSLASGIIPTLNQDSHSKKSGY
jgi:hypothetical protein